jgi:hypothetical protein
MVLTSAAKGFSILLLSMQIDLTGIPRTFRKRQKEFNMYEERTKT